MNKKSEGQDCKGTYYPSIDQMWEAQLNQKKVDFKVIHPIGSIQNWYQNANKYWTKIQPTNDGVLGGYGNLSTLDVNFSLKFVLELIKQFPKLGRQSVLDCGAGIGRISKSLLCQIYKTVDLIDQCQKFIQKSRQILAGKNVRHYYVKGLQQFNFQQKYDCVWIQWVLSHLTDQAAINFFKKAKASLNDNGIIILKENHCASGFIVDKDDYSVTRSKQLFLKLIQKSDLTIVKEQQQLDWPKDLFQIRIYALK